MAVVTSYEDNVFINCPFDSAYQPLLDAIVFCLHDAGFVVRCALEFGDSSQNRLSKIFRLIAECKYSIHDLSRVTLDTKTFLPRFNMPLELGLFLGCKEFGTTRHRTKCYLILDSEPYRYRSSLSDIAGQDIQVHENNPLELIRQVRTWLTTVSRRTTTPGGDTIGERFQIFQTELPVICRRLHKRIEELTFLEYQDAAVVWLRENPLR